MPDPLVPPPVPLPAPPVMPAATPVAEALAIRTEQALDRLRAGLMRQSLSHLLDGAAGVRRALPHLAALEVALADHGTAVLGGLSRPVLAKVCRQLAALPVSADDAPLLDLQERLLCALEAAPVPTRIPAGPAHHPAAPLHGLSDFLTEEKLLVGEASYDDFADAAAAYATTQRGAL